MAAVWVAFEILKKGEKVMRKFRVIFYKSRWFDGHKIDNLIDIWTCLANLPYVTYKAKLNLKDIWKFIKDFNYSHVEKWTPGGYSLRPKSHDWWNGQCATSTMMAEGDEPQGTVERPARRVLRHPERWDGAEFKVKDYNYNSAERWAELELAYNFGYAKQDITKFLPVVRHIVKTDPTRNICSEFVHNYMVRCKIFLKFRVLSPRLLAWMIYKEIGKDIIPVKEA